MAQMIRKPGTSEQQAMLRALVELGGVEKTAKEISERAEVDVRTGGARMGALARRGLVARSLNHEDGLDYYTVTQAGRDQAGKIELVSDAMVTKALDAFFTPPREWESNPRSAMERALKAVIK